MENGGSSSKSNITENGKPENVKLLSPSLGVHTFQGKIMEDIMYFQVIKMQDSFHVWVGKNGSFGHMSVAMTTAGEKNPVSTVLIGGNDSPTSAMAQRLSKRTGKQVFVSGEFHSDQLHLPLIEKRITEELNNHPEKF